MSGPEAESDAGSDKAERSDKPKPTRNRRRRGRELALQALFTLDHQPLSMTTARSPIEEGPKGATLAAALYRIRERGLGAELECLVADGEREEAQATAQALLVLDPKSTVALEVTAWLAGKGPALHAPSKDERVELEAVRGGLDELAFCDQLVRGVAEHRDAIDKLLQDSSTNWRVARMAVVDRNILRMGVFEIQHLKDIPPRVTLNEAIEIGKRYGTGESGAFINGILDKIATQLGHVRGGRPGASGGPGNGARDPGPTPGNKGGSRKPEAGSGPDAARTPAGAGPSDAPTDPPTEAQ